MAFQICILLLLLTSCGDDFTGGSRIFKPTQEEQQIAPPPEAFRTRLSPSLLIQGTLCLGDETTEPGGHGLHCDPGQYLIIIDDVNTCDADGVCTVFIITPIIGELQNADARIPEESVFNIIPKSPVNDDQSKILSSVHVSSDLNGNGTVFYSRQ